MSVLLAILSCQRPRDVSLELAQFSTFLVGSSIEYRFFRGRGAAERADVVALDVDDDLESLPFKTQAACRWALENNFEYLFKCDNDTYVRPERLLQSGFTNQDYSGWFSYEPCYGAYASGGSGYWLSKRAMELVANATTIFADPLKDDPIDRSSRGEDLQVGWVMRDNGIMCHRDGRYRLREPGPLRNNDLITLHDVLWPLKSPERMHVAHQRWLDS